MKKSKFTSFLLYSLREVLLVVIGILIAVNINNWNKNKENRKEEIVLLKQLLKEQKEDHKQLKVLTSWHESIHLGLLRWMEMMSNPPDQISNDTIANYMSLLGWVPEYRPKLGVLNSTISSGKISLISNDSLVLRISSWDGLLNDYYIYTNSIKMNTENVITPFFIKNFSYRAFHFQGWTDDGETAFKIDYKSLLKSREIESMTSLKRIDSEQAYRAARDLSMLQEEIIRLIDVHLRNLSKEYAN